VAIDGKVLRGTLGKLSKCPASHLVNACSVKNNLCLGQIKVSDKSNEITAIPKLLALLDIEGATITTDAMGCQFKIANQIVKAKGDYVLALTVFESKQSTSQKKNVTSYPAIMTKMPNLSPMLSAVTGM
jgi:hypothetical protein